MHVECFDPAPVRHNSSAANSLCYKRSRLRDVWYTRMYGECSGIIYEIIYGLSVGSGIGS